MSTLDLVSDNAKVLSNEDRKKMLKEFSAPVRQLIRQIESARQATVRDFLLNYYKEAVLWRELLDNKEEQGLKNNTVVFAYFGVKPRDIYRQVAVARAFTEAEIKKMAQQTNCNNEIIGKTLIEVLATCNEEDRDFLYQQWKKEGLTRRQIQDYLKDKRSEGEVDQEIEAEAEESPSSNLPDPALQEETTSNRSAAGRTTGEDHEYDDLTYAKSGDFGLDKPLSELDATLQKAIDQLEDLQEYDVPVTGDSVLSRLLDKILVQGDQVSHLTKLLHRRLTGDVIDASSAKKQVDETGVLPSSDNDDDDDIDAIWSELESSPVGASDMPEDGFNESQEDDTLFSDLD